MKIIHLVQRSQLRGAEIFASQLSNHLAALGHEVILITLFDGDAELPFAGVQLHLKRPLKKRLWDYAGWKQLATLIRQHQPDILQANAGDTLKFVVASKKIFGWSTPVVFRNANKMSDFIDSKLKYRFNRYLLNAVHHIASVSGSCSEDVIHFFSLPPNKVTTIEIGIDFREIGKLPDDIVPIFLQGPVYLNVASLVPEKNHIGLLNIFASLRKTIPNAQLIIVGKGKLESELVAKVKQRNLKEAVHFLGYRNDVLEIMAASEAFLIPSLIEGLPAVILEAMWAHCPVIAYEVGGIGEVVQNNVSGFLVAKNDEEGFLRCVLKLIERDCREKITKSAYEVVTRKFDNQLVAARFSELYKRLL